MRSAEEQLQEALADFMCAASQRADVSGSLKRISELQAQLGADAPPMLRHYLERRSYQKALDFLNSGQTEKDEG